MNHTKLAEQVSLHTIGKYYSRPADIFFMSQQSPIIAINAPYPGKRKAGSVGKSVGGVNAVIMNPDTQQPVGPGVEGEICCYGRNVMRGYYRNPESTAEVISVAPDGKSRL